MRMIGIGLMGFLLAGVALLLSTMNILEKGQRYVSELTAGPQLVFEDRSAVPAADTHRVVVYRSNPNQPVILSGLPAYQGVAFTMPVDARPTSGYLQIDATLQVLDGVEGVLRISIDNARRGEMLLRPGEVGRSLQIPLSPTDFARDQLVVSFSLQGKGPKAQCSADEGFEAVVEIETTSAVFLTLDRPLETARDRVTAWGQIVRVAWPDWLKPEEKLRRLVLASQLRHRGVETVMIDAHSPDALTTTALRTVMPLFPGAQDSGPVVQWPRPIAIQGANAGLRRFKRTTLWRERYDLRDAEAMRYADTLEVNFALGAAPAAAPLSLTVTLNNRLIHHQSVDAAQNSLELSISLPADFQSAINVIELRLSALDDREGPCTEGPERVAELLPSSRITTGDVRFSDATIDLQRALANMGALRIGMLSELTAADAQVASAMLSRLMPEDLPLKPDSDAAQIIVISPNDPAFTLPQSEPIWLVTSDANGQQLSVRLLEGGSILPRTGLAILIIPNGLNLAEVTT